MAHDLAERILRGEKNVGFPDDEMEEGVWEYVEYVRGLPGHEHGKVEEFMLHPYIPEFGGTADFLIVTEDTIHVVDFKYGRMPVSIEDNKQILSYLLIAWERHPGRREFFGSIVQPRVARPQCQRFTEKEIFSHLLDVERAVKDTAYTPGGHCIWCPLLLKCEASHDYQQRIASTVFDDRPSVQECLEIMSASEVLADKAKLAKAHLLKLALKGHKVPGHKIVENLANRTWRDENHAISQLKKVGIPEEELYKKTVRSPAQIEKIANKKLVAKLCERVKRGPILAPETSKKPDYDPLSAFTD